MTSMVNIIVEALYSCVSTHYVYINRATLCGQSMLVIRPLPLTTYRLQHVKSFRSPIIGPSALQVLQETGATRLASGRPSKD